jgi:hypothetical protein
MNLAPLRRGFFVRLGLAITETNGSPRRSAGAWRSMTEPLFLRRLGRPASTPPLGGARLWCNNMESSMSRATILALSLVAALALSSGAMAQGGGAGGGGGGAGGASGASGTTGNSSGSRSGTSGNSVAQPPSGQSSPTGNTAAQPPGSTGQNSINSPGTGVGPGPSPGSMR